MSEAITHAEVAFEPADLAALREAKHLLESPGLAAQISNLIGGPLELGFKLMPAGWKARVARATESALFKCLDIAVNSLPAQSRPRAASDRRHKLLCAGSGALGGAFGIWALPLELPVSTTLIMRSVADIARSEGQDLSHIETRLACLEVFALGGRSEHDNAAESGYWVVRASLARTLSEAATFVADRGVLAEGAPPLVRLVAAIASRLGTEVSAEVAAKALPLVSAATGAAINLLFINHFQRMARGHFAVRRLEQKYGHEAVERQYKALSA